MRVGVVWGFERLVSSGEVVNNLEIWNRVKEGPLVDVSKLAVNRSVELEWICKHAMARAIANRCPSMDELGVFLYLHIEGLPVMWTSPKFRDRQGAYVGLLLRSMDCGRGITCSEYG
ncbi:MAG: hypothetical protein ACI8TQ_004129 [Planctomycetota bacterium]|jgi:hypothetical protein